MKVLIRKAELHEVPQGAALHVRTWQSAYKGLMPENYLKSLRVEDFETSWRKSISEIDENRLRVVAADGKRIVGFLGAGPCRWEVPGFSEELYGIYVDPSEQGKGIGRQLLNHYSSWLLSRNKRSFVLWVLRENHSSRRFYEATGGRCLEIEKSDRKFGDQNLAEIAYGWDELVSL